MKHFITVGRFLGATLACTALAGGIPAAGAATNLIVNGSFSESVNGCEAATQTLVGWMVTAGNVDIMEASCGGTAAPNGQQYFVDLTGSFAELGESNAGAIAQTVPTVVGQAYTLTFAFGANAEWKEFRYPNDSPLKAMVVRINGALAGVYSLPTANVTATDAQWSKRTISFTAGSTSTTISFASLNGSSTNPSDFGPLLSDVALFAE